MMARDAREDAMQVVMLGLGEDLFAIEAGLVREIIDPVPVTRVAGAKPHLAAMINVRGNVVPLADVRLRLGLPPTSPTADTRVVVLEIDIGGDPVVVGVLADKVYEVTELSPGGTQPTPSVGLAWPPEFIRFIAKWNDRFVIVPELPTLLN